MVLQEMEGAGSSNRTMQMDGYVATGKNYFNKQPAEIKNKYVYEVRKKARNG